MNPNNPLTEQELMQMLQGQKMETMTPISKLMRYAPTAMQGVRMLNNTMQPVAKEQRRYVGGL